LADRVPTMFVPGSLVGFFDPAVIPLQVSFFASAKTVGRAWFRLTDPGVTGSVVVELNTAQSGAGTNKITITVDVGERFATGVGTIVIPAGGSLWQRILSAGPEAMNLSGEYEVN